MIKFMYILRIFLSNFIYSIAFIVNIFHAICIIIIIIFDVITTIIIAAAATEIFKFGFTWQLYGILLMHCGGC